MDIAYDFKIDYQMIGRRVKIARIRNGITQDALAERTELSNTHISNIETGKTKLGLPAMIRIANALSVSVDELLCDNVTQSKAVFLKEASEVLTDCNNEELLLFIEMVKTMKTVIRNNFVKAE